MTEKIEKLWSTPIRCGIPPVCGRWWIRIYARRCCRYTAYKEKGAGKYDELPSCGWQV